MTRQYIGARYVVKVYENSLDPSLAEWEASVNYEPLTLVTYNNGSYMSKKEVPASVGDPASNPTFWVQTGFYNGQIAYLEGQVIAINQAINDLDGDLDTLEHNVETTLDALFNNYVNFKIAGRRVVVVTDSYGMNRGDQVSFTTPLQTYLGLSNSDYYAYAEGGMGINKVGQDGHTAQTLLAANIGNITDKDTISDVILAIGLNDTLALTGLETAINNMVSYVKTQMPSATIHFAFIGNSLQFTIAERSNYITALNVYRDTCGKNLCHWIEGINSIMFPYEHFIDLVHPTTAAHDLIAKNIINGLTGASIDYSARKTVTLTGSGAAEGKISSSVCYQAIDKATKYMLVAFNFSNEFAVTANTEYEIATMTDPLFICASVVAIQGIIYLNSNVGLLQCIVTSRSNKIYIMPTQSATIAAGYASRYGVLIQSNIYG